MAPARPSHADNTVQRIYRQAEREFGMLAPPLALHSPVPSALAASWLMLRESLLADCSVPRTTKEAVAAAVSHGNSCPYCVTVHGSALAGLLDNPTARAIAAGDFGSIPDPTVRAVAGWARGSATRQDSLRQHVPFRSEQAPELAGVVVAFQYINRMVNIFFDDSPLPSALPAMARSAALGLLGRLLSGPARSQCQPGAALELLPPAPLPEDLWWAAGNPFVAQAFARAAAAFEAAGEAQVPAAVRAVVTARLADWDGQPVGLSRSWVEPELTGLSPAERACGRLALLTALASFQVDRSVIEDFRLTGADDHVLIATTSWASMAAARRVGSWLRISPVGGQPGHSGNV